MMELKCTGCANDGCNRNTCTCACHKNTWDQITDEVMDRKIEDAIDYLVNIDDEKELQ